MGFFFLLIYSRILPLFLDFRTTCVRTFVYVLISGGCSEMMPELGARSVYGGGAGNDYNEEAASDRGRELGILRSGSAPPTVEGALGGGFSGGAVSEEELRSDPAYRSYYYQNVKLNPRLPHPLPSREDRILQRPAASSVVAEGGEMYESGGGGGGGESLFAMQPGLGGFEEEKVMQGRWGGEGLVGYAGVGGIKQKSAADMVQVEKAVGIFVVFGGFLEASLTLPFFGLKFEILFDTCIFILDCSFLLDVREWYHRIVVLFLYQALVHALRRIHCHYELLIVDFVKFKHAQLGFRQSNHFYPYCAYRDGRDMWIVSLQIRVLDGELLLL